MADRLSHRDDKGSRAAKPRRLRKIALGGGALLLACVLATILFLDASAARLVSMAATSALGVTTTVRSAHIGLFDGRSSISGLAIEQPAGFPKGSMIELREGTITVGLRGLMGQSIVIDELTLTGVTVHLDEAGGKLNLEVLAANLSGDDAKAANDPGARPSAAREVTVRRLRIREVRVIVSGTASSLAGKPIDVTIPDIDVVDLGTKTALSQIADAVSTELVSRLTVAILKARIEGLPDTIASGLNNAAGSLTDALSGLATQAGEGLKKAAEGVGSAVKGLLDGIGK